MESEHVTASATCRISAAGHTRRVYALVAAPLCILDPAFGSGGMFVQSVGFVAECHKSPENNHWGLYP
jgi:hypothetical protein